MQIGQKVAGAQLRFRNLLVVIKQTAFEEYSQLKLRGQAPKALRWKRLEQRYHAHKNCVTDLLTILRKHNVNFSCVNRVELDRQHLAEVDLLVAVGGDGTVLSSAHFLDHGTIPLLGINSDPNQIKEDRIVKGKKSDERRSHGALCTCTSIDMEQVLAEVLYGGGTVEHRRRIRCKVKSTFSETRMVPALNDILIANPSPAAVSRFRMGWQKLLNSDEKDVSVYGTITRFGTKAYAVSNSINVWSSGIWVCTSTGATAAMEAAGGEAMPDLCSPDLQYLIREHIIEGRSTGTSLQEANYGIIDNDINNAMIRDGEKVHMRWNSQRGRIFIDGAHLTHNLELGDEISIDNEAPPLQLLARSFDRNSLV